MKLNEAPLNTPLKVLKVEGERSLRRRVMDMGITSNQIVVVKRIAPLGDPIEINVRSYELSLRKADASIIEVEVVA